MRTFQHGPGIPARHLKGSLETRVFSEMDKKSGGAPLVSSRRATQISVQRLIMHPPSLCHIFAPLCPGLGGGQETSSLELPHFLSSMTATSSVCPCCVGCGSSMKWDDWHRDASALNIGLGKFYSRCVLCQANDALFKDGSLS